MSLLTDNTEPSDHERGHDSAHSSAPAIVSTEALAAKLIGLSTDEAAKRLATHGANELVADAGTPWWKRLLAGFTDRLILMLMAAAVVALVVSGELKTPIVVLSVVVLNVVIGFIQEQRAEKSVEALRRSMTSRARVRRGGELMYVDSVALVPGDIVLLEAGDRVPADGILLTASNLEATEAALTGESQPSSKVAGGPSGEHVPLGDRSGMVFMNSAITRGRAEFEVSATGMGTQIGRLATLLRETEASITPLQRQLQGLAHSVAKLALAIVAVVFVIGLIRGESFSQIALTSVALAVAAIPEGLPAVTVVTLAVGVAKMAKRNAIVKRLASVETLGCATVICSDKTGTLTLNEMTAVELITQLEVHEVTGGGYSPDGTIRRRGDDDPVGLDTALMSMALCNDAEIRRGDNGEWQLVGDPTEGALVVLAAKGGIDTAALRNRHPRIAEVPFDSANKFMATVHHLTSSSGDPVVRVIVKGAPDVLFVRCARVIDRSGEASPFEAHRSDLEGHNHRLGGSGYRVLAVAQREMSPEAWEEFSESGGDPIGLVGDLTLVALIGIVDPPRPEARVAISEAHGAGIAVKMITGDHVSTATAIGEQLGLRGKAVSGSELESMSDEELDSRIEEVSVFARVSPEHKLRLVKALQKRGHVVAMTGDGVNDAPALKQADLGVAMGITGTDVSKEAATMVLADDNFATIVDAVGRGRGIYSNIVKFVRFQLSTTLGFAMLFLLASIIGIAEGKPFTAIAILWVNLIMDGPPAMALGLDPVDGDAMKQQPRPAGERILTRRRWSAVAVSSLVMALGTLAVLEWGPGEALKAGEASVAGTMAFNTFVLFQFFNILNARHDTRSVFNRSTFTNHWLWVSLAMVIGLQVAVTHVGPFQDLFDTTSISGAQWLVCIGVSATVLVADEIRKLIARSRMAR